MVSHKRPEAEAGKRRFESKVLYLSYMTPVLSVDFVWVTKKCRDFLQTVEEFNDGECEDGVKFAVEKRLCELVPIHD